MLLELLDDLPKTFPSKQLLIPIFIDTGNQGYYATQFIGYQDTILANTGAQLYAKCLVVGAIDFIFGQKALAWFENNDIRTIAAGSITASGRSDSTNPSWYVINNSNVQNINSSVATGNNYLGRPWGDYARVIFQNTYLGNNINAAGWSVWSKTLANTDHVTFEEYVFPISIPSTSFGVIIPPHFLSSPLFQIFATPTPIELH